MRRHVLPLSAAGQRFCSISMPVPQPHGAQRMHGLASSGVSNSTMPQPFERPAASRSQHSGLLKENEVYRRRSGPAPDSPLSSLITLAYLQAGNVCQVGSVAESWNRRGVRGLAAELSHGHSQVTHRTSPTSRKRSYKQIGREISTGLNFEKLITVMLHACQAAAAAHLQVLP